MIFELVGLLGLVLWVYWSFRRSSSAFKTLLVGFVVFYSRLFLRLSDSSSSPSTIYLLDIPWLLLLVVALRDYKVFGFFRVRLPLAVWGMTPYVGLACSLPILGVVFYGFPLSYAILGFRVLQWVSFGILSYSISKRYGEDRAARLLIDGIVFSSLMHFAYAMIQFLYASGILGPEWVVFDRFLETQGAKTWFYYPRVTGLMTNPNNYGLFGAMVVVAALAVVVTRTKLSRGIWTLLVLSGLYAVIFSGSRSALVGLGVGAVTTFMGVMASRPLPIALGATVRAAVVFAVVVIVQVAVLMPHLPDRGVERFLNLFRVITVGADADRNFSARVRLWQDHIENYLNNYTFGTMVSPEYVVGHAVDSYYINALVQGTPVFLMTFLLFLANSWFLGVRASRRHDRGLPSVLGLILAGWIGVMAGGSLSVGPPQHVYFMTMFWSVAGVCTYTLLHCDRR